MGIMIEDTNHIGKRPLRQSLSQHRLWSNPTAADVGAETPTTSNAKRGRLSPQQHVPPASPATLELDVAYDICHECPPAASSVADDALPTELRQGVLRPAPFRPAAPVGRTSSSQPTAADYANLFFCDSFEEEKIRASLFGEHVPIDNSPYQAKIGKTFAHCRRKRRRVSFGAAINTIHLLRDTPPSHAMTPEERSASWHGRPDLELFKSSAQLCIREMRERVTKGRARVTDRSAFRSLMLEMEEETGSSIRGLEHRVFRRKQTRQGLIRDVLECQSHVKGLAGFGHVLDDGERVSLLSRASSERSAKAREMAYVDAKEDHMEVYGDGAVEEGDNERGSKRRKERLSLISL